jgi:antitoxin component YwqK of YwqJK toxin-antitoxin module
MENLIKRDLLTITLPLLLIAGCTKATVEYFTDENGIMYVEYNGNPNTQRPFTGEIVEHYEEKDGGHKKNKGLYKDGKLDGLSIFWDREEILDTEDTYKDGELILKRCFDLEGNVCECSDLGRGCK